MIDLPTDSAPAHSAATTSPQVRTLLLTDLCDSTLLVERLGDAPAAELFRAHDRLVLELQQRWRGRLIDRSDGLLLLFERPIDGLGFALDYTRGLRELSDRPEVRQRKLVLQARAGLHVGEVLTWRNSEAAVQAGAKPLEVEGLAKPLAGRLMTLARPGQVLLSATAEPLARRAARELGERSEHLIWKSHGRWRLKGVPDGQEIFEVGEPGYAPLRAPKQNGGKAWRDIPVWRRPAALAAELMLVIGVGTGAWFLTRPTPAIAFNERDWVVVGDLRNLTGQPVLDESLEQAFRISLEQSRYVNVLSDLKVRDTLQLMKRGPATPLDRGVASEIALRDGARAVILPTVAEVGGRVRVSAEVIDPHTQTTVYAESADGVGAGSALGSIDKVTAELREKLGEAIASIERDSAPLPQVSTSNLDALKAYALGEAKEDGGDHEAARGYYARALDLDPKFALAQVGIGRVLIGAGRLSDGRTYLMQAVAMRSRLTPREALSLQTLVARFGPVPELMSRWKQLVEMYPDMPSARFGYAQDGWMMANRFAAGVPDARAAASPQSPYSARAHYLEGILLLGDGRADEALQAFHKSRAAGFSGAGFNEAYAHELMGRYAEADRGFASRGVASLTGQDLESLEYRFITSVDRGRWEDVSKAVPAALALSGKDPLWIDGMWKSYAASADVLATGQAKEALRERMQWLQTSGPKLDAVHSISSANYRLAIGYLAARSNDREALDRVLSELGDGKALAGYPMAREAYQVLLAERERMDGAAASAVHRLAPIARGKDALLMVHVALARAYADEGNLKRSRAEWTWVSTHRGRAFVERGTGGLLDPINIADTTLARMEIADLSIRLNDGGRARSELKSFANAWRPEGLPRALRARFDALQASLLRQ